MTADSRILDLATRRGAELSEILKALVLVESPSTDPGAQGPVFDILAGALIDLDFEVRRVPGKQTGGQLHAVPRTASKGRPSQLVVGHVDTVWPRGTLEEMPLIVEDGVIRGPGTFDMKGGLAQLIVALRVLRDLGLTPEVAPVIFLNSDEEIGSPESEPAIRRLAGEVCRALVLEPALGAAAKIKTSRRGTGHFEIGVTGRSAHTGLAPEEGASAILELSHVIQTLHELTDRERGIEVNVGQVRGGVRPNVVAAEATASVDVRVKTTADARWVEERVRELRAITPGTTLTIRGAVDRPPMEATEGNQRLWFATREVGRRLGLELEEAMSGGASDGNFTSQYTPTIDGLGPVGDGAHAVHEFIDLRATLERVALLASVLLLPGEL